MSWLFLMLAPRWKFTHLIIVNGAVSALLAIVYIFLITATGNIDFSKFASLEGIKSLFSNDALLVAGWVHYLAFDLFVGSWILRDGQKHNVRHFILMVCLFFTFMTGPAGLLLYFISRVIKTRSVAHENF